MKFNKAFKKSSLRWAMQTKLHVIISHQTKVLVLELTLLCSIKLVTSYNISFKVIFKWKMFFTEQKVFYKWRGRYDRGTLPKIWFKAAYSIFVTVPISFNSLNILTGLYLYRFGGSREQVTGSRMGDLLSPTTNTARRKRLSAIELPSGKRLSAIELLRFEVLS